MPGAPGDAFEQQRTRAERDDISAGSEHGNAAVRRAIRHKASPPVHPAVDPSDEGAVMTAPRGGSSAAYTSAAPRGGPLRAWHPGRPRVLFSSSP